MGKIFGKENRQEMNMYFNEGSEGQRRQGRVLVLGLLKDVR